jgi:hypothetical protein
MAVTSFEQARRTNAASQGDLDAVQRGKSAAAKKAPGSDTSAAVLRRVKNAATGPWTADHGDRTYGTNSQ